MCILFVYRDPSASANPYRLIIASNRDEWFARPALPAHFWKENSNCLGGMDMEEGREGGTWLALSKTGKLGIILNLNGEKRPSDLPGKGRGNLISNYVKSDVTTKAYLDDLHLENINGYPYNPYSLLLIEMQNAETFFLTSALNSPGTQLLKDKVLAFGNSPLDCPYQKVKGGKKRFAHIVKESEQLNEAELIDKLLNFLKSKERHLPDAELKKRTPNVFKYEFLSSICISEKGYEYGTRTHSIILVDKLNRVTFVEETLLPDCSWKRQTFNLSL